MPLWVAEQNYRFFGYFSKKEEFVKQGSKDELVDVEARGKMGFSTLSIYLYDTIGLLWDL